MIIDITHPQFNIAKLSVDQRLDCLSDLCEARDNRNLISDDEFLAIACGQWHVQMVVNKIKNK